jgi:PadR family transcriptional regulator PadR
MNPDLFENLRLELRRGCVVLAVLASLRTEQYGYTLRKALSELGMEIDEGTGLLASEWREEAKRNKRFYRLSDEGRQVLERLLTEWKAIGTSLDGILEEGQR